MNRTLGATALLLCSVIGSLLALTAAIDLMAFLMTHQPGKVSDPLQTGKLWTLLCCYVLLTVLFLTTSIRVARASPVQESVAGWSPYAVAVWFLVSSYLLQVYYPLPSHPHHLDKLLFILGGLIVWGMWLNFWPVTLERVLDSRGYDRIKAALIIILVFVVVGEIAFRLADPILARKGLFEAKQSPTSLKPYAETQGSIGHTNAQGFRDRDRVMEKPTSSPRVLAVGDSFTWGVGVTYDETFVTILEKSLQEIQPGTEVVNLGVIGFEPEHELHLVQHYGIHLHPDLVMLNVFVGNDIIRKRGADTEEALVVGGNSYFVHHNGNWLHDHLGPDRWFLYHDINYLIRVDLAPVWHLFRNQGRHDRSVQPGKNTTISVPWHLDLIEYIEDRSDIFLTEDTPLFARHWSHTLEKLNALHEFLLARGVPLLVVLIPEQAQLDQELQRDFIVAVGGRREDYEFEKPQRLLTEWCRRQKVICHNLLETFKQDYHPGTLYFSNDPHWSAAGHKVAAAAILSTLQEQLFTPSAGVHASVRR